MKLDTLMRRLKRAEERARDRARRLRRKLRSRAQLCGCDGWWFPHRHGSRASPEYQRTHGTYGCGDYAYLYRKRPH